MLYNPLRTVDAPPHMIEQRRERQTHSLQTILLLLLSLAGAFVFAPLIIYVVQYNVQLSPTFLDSFKQYLGLITSGHIATATNQILHNSRFQIIHIHLFGSQASLLISAILTYLIVATALCIPFALRALTNPHNKMVMLQYAAWCDTKTLRAMERRRQIGIHGGYLLNLGIWPTGIRKGQQVRLIETVSVLCLAPPGTGKTAGLVIPSIITADKVSLVINDIKPEIQKMTSYYRSTISYVFTLDFSKTDAHYYFVDGERHPITEMTKEKGLTAKQEHIFHTRWNPLSRKLMPPPGSERDTYITALTYTVIAPKEGGGDNDYFVNKGRDALSGFIHAAVAIINDQDHEERYNGFPSSWIGKEASFPMIAEWLALALYQASQTEEGKEKPQDPLKDWLQSLCDTINPNIEAAIGKTKAGTTRRGFNSLSQLINMADKERSGILGTLDEGLLPFKNESVMERTDSTDFTPDDLRGIQDEHGNWKPVTLYVCANQADASAFATITALLYETLSKSLLSYGPGEYNPKTQRKLGPYPVAFLIDEMAKLPKTTCLLEGPDLGRSKGITYVLVAQSYGQIEKKYTKADVSIINTTTGVKFILPQNDADTIKATIALVGQTTVRIPSISMSEGMGRNSSPLTWNRTDQTQQVDFLRHQDVAAMKPGNHILIAQNYPNRPMKLKTAWWFEDPVLSKRVHYKGTGAPIGPDLPDFIYSQKLIAYYEETNQKEKAAAVRSQNVFSGSCQKADHFV